MNLLTKLLFVSVAFVLFSCERKVDKSADFTQEWLFTKGIEGPAVDSKGNLYAVNYMREGTVGIVDSKAKVSLFVDLPEGSIANGLGLMLRIICIWQIILSIGFFILKMAVKP